jgi:hypothetical protein
MMSSRVIPLRQDIRALCLPERVDLATAHYDTINHLIRPKDVGAAFASVRRALTPGGFFLFDFITPNQRPGVQRHRMRAGRHVRIVQHIAYRPGARMLRIIVVIRRAMGSPCLVERHVERAYSPRSIVRWLGEAGFTVRGLFDANTLIPVTSTVPPRVVVVAQVPRG